MYHYMYAFIKNKDWQEQTNPHHSNNGYGMGQAIRYSVYKTKIIQQKENEDQNQNQNQT